MDMGRELNKNTTPGSSPFIYFSKMKNVNIYDTNQALSVWHL